MRVFGDRSEAFELGEHLLAWRLAFLEEAANVLDARGGPVAAVRSAPA
jgi:hypothetical protein